MSDYAYWKELAETLEAELGAAKARLAELEASAAAVAETSAPHTRTKRQAEEDLADIHSQVEPVHNAAVEGAEA